MGKVGRVAAVLAMFIAGTAGAQTAPPGNIWLIALQTKNDKTTVKSARKITDNPQYTSQPHFVSDSALYYTQEVLTDSGSQMDTIYYDIQSRSHQNLTRSQVSEYSPTPLPNGNGFSTILVDNNAKQWLWLFNEKGTAKRKLVDAEPVGYQVWLNNNQLLAFILGEPHTLQLLSTSGHAEIIDDNIGASLWNIPGTDLYSYTKNPAPDNQPWTIMAYDPETHHTTALVNLPNEAYYMAWSDTGSALTSHGSKIVKWDFKNMPDERRDSLGQDSASTSNGENVAPDWELFVELKDYCPDSISRMHMSNNGEYLAVVCHSSQE